MGYLGVYDFRPYCDYPKCDEVESFCDDQSGNAARARARRDGWFIGLDRRDGTREGNGYCLCPKHNTKENR